VGASSILDEYQANGPLDAAPPPQFNDNRSNHSMFNEVGGNQANLIKCHVIFAMLPRDIIQLLRIVLKLMVIWLTIDIGRTVVGTFK